MVAEKHNEQDLYRSVLEGPFVHELMVTNYAGYQVRTEYGNINSVSSYRGWKTWDEMTLVARDVFPTPPGRCTRGTNLGLRVRVPKYSCDILVVAHGYALSDIAS